MNALEQLAIMDGWKWVSAKPYGVWVKGEFRTPCLDGHPQARYTTSYDALVPLLKQYGITFDCTRSPAQLGEQLLKTHPAL